MPRTRRRRRLSEWRICAGGEEEAGLTGLDAYRRFARRVHEVKRGLLRFLIQAKEDGKSVVGYGAPAKGNTLLNFCGVGTDFLDFTVDRSPHKQGCLLPGTRIPIREPDANSGGPAGLCIDPAVEPPGRDHGADVGRQRVGRGLCGRRTRGDHHQGLGRRMIFEETPLHGAYVLRPERVEDERGFFARTFCREEFEAHGLPSSVAQCNLSFNHRKGTLRGMHFQKPPHEEDKLVRCIRGALFDAIVDLRRLGSETYLETFAVELSAENRVSLFVPKGFAHGFQTLEDDTEVFYQMSELYVPGFGGGYRWDDPAFGIPWPLEPTVISERDRALPTLAEERSP